VYKHEQLHIILYSKFIIFPPSRPFLQSRRIRGKLIDVLGLWQAHLLAIVSLATNLAQIQRGLTADCKTFQILREAFSIASPDLVG